VPLTLIVDHDVTRAEGDAFELCWNGGVGHVDHGCSGPGSEQDFMNRLNHDVVLSGARRRRSRDSHCGGVAQMKRRKKCARDQRAAALRGLALEPESIEGRRSAVT
jgi:hypothetical protein